MLWCKTTCSCPNLFKNLNMIWLLLWFVTYFCTIKEFCTNLFLQVFFLSKFTQKTGGLSFCCSCNLLQTHTHTFWGSSSRLCRQTDVLPMNVYFLPSHMSTTVLIQTWKVFYSSLSNIFFSAAFSRSKARAYFCLAFWLTAGSISLFVQPTAESKVRSNEAGTWNNFWQICFQPAIIIKNTRATLCMFAAIIHDSETTELVNVTPVKYKVYSGTCSRGFAPILVGSEFLDLPRISQSKWTTTTQ